MSKLMKKGSPLLILALLSLVVIGTGAAIVLYWTSSHITSTFTFSVEGIDSYIIAIPDTGNPINDYFSFLDYYADPESHVPTQLVTSIIKENEFGWNDPLTNAFVYCYEGGNVAGNLVLDLNVNITGEGAENVDWSVSTRLGGVYYNSYAGFVSMDQSTLPGYVFDSNGRLIIPSAEMTRVTWVPVDDYVLSEGILPGYANFLVIEFAWTGGGQGIDTTLYGDHVVDISVSISASIES